MAYRGKRNPPRADVQRDQNFHHNDSSYVSEEDHSSEDIYEDSELRNQNGLPKITKEMQKTTRKTMEQSRYNPSIESKIPVARRGLSKRVPNARRDDQITPVRERFRARYQEESEPSTKNEDHRTDYSKNRTNNHPKKVTFYRNGDKHFKGRSFVITRQRYRSFESLLEDLSKAIPLPYGVRYVLSSQGHVINSINELEDGGYYICSSGDQLIRNINYNAEKRKDKAFNDAPIEGIENIRLSVPSDSSSNSSNSPRINNKTPKPRVITIINEERNLKCKILLNRKTAKSYEDILQDVSEMMKLQGEHVQELYSSQKSLKVGGLSEMFHGDDVYTAVIVQDVSNKRNLSNPSSHSSNGDGLSPSAARKQQKSRKKQRRELAAHNKGVTIKVKDKKLTFYPPSKSDVPLADNIDEALSVPSARPQLHWVYGYQGKDTRYNLHVLPSGELLYFVSRVVVIYNRKPNKQRHYTEHADDIKCIAVHPNQWYIATGQSSGLSLDQNELSHVRIWDSETLLTLTVLQLDDYGLSVIAMAFSVEDNGDILSCIDSSGDSYRLSVWEWKDKKCLAQSKEFSNVPLAVMFDPDDNKTIVSCGKEHIYFWRWHNGKLERKNGFFENNPVPLYITCLDFAPNGDLFTGDSNGSITAWSKVSKKVKFVVRNAHEKSILSLHVLDSGLMITAGGVDGKVCAWDANKYFNLPLREIQLSESTGISALQPLQTGETDVTLLAGTTANSILEGSFTKPFTTIVKGNKLEVPSFAVHPSRDLFVTASLDKTATLWSAVNHEIIWSVNVEFPIRVGAFYSTGSVIAFGTTQGRWIVLNADSGMHQASFQDGNEPITDLEYSPDGEHIAVGSKDGNIYIHAVYDDGMTYRRVGCCSNHTAPVLFLDWSVDGCFVQSMSTEYDIITWEIGAFEREDSQNVIRDTEWNTRNVVLGYDVVGVWQSTPTDGNLVTSSDLAWSHELLAIGDELGYMRIFRYPCSYQGAQYHQVRAHSSTVLRVMFLSSDTFLLSTAGQDCAVMQWSMEGMVDPLTTKTKKQKPENLKVVISNSDDQSDIDVEERDNYSSKEQSKRTRNGFPDTLDGEEDDETTSSDRKGRQQKLDEKFRKTKSKPNSNRGRSKEPLSEISDEFPSQTSEDYSSENYKQQHEEKRRGKEAKGLRGRRERPSNHRRSFEEDMYQDVDDTNDERKERVLRARGRARRRYEEDDVSMEEDSDDDTTPRSRTRPKQNGFQRPRSPAEKRNGRRTDREMDNSFSEEYSDETRDRNSYRNDRYGGRRKIDREPAYRNRNKR